MTCHNLDLDSASDWLRQICFAARPIKSTTQIWVVTRHQYGISEVVSQTSFRGETSGTVAKSRLISQANPVHVTVKKKKRLQTIEITPECSKRQLEFWIFWRFLWSLIVQN